MRHFVALSAAVAALLGGCSVSLHLKEARPVVITADAAPPPPPHKPRRVEVGKDRLEVTETILFETSSWTISSESNDVLDEIAGVINKHPEIKKMRVEGHTDNEGDSPHNLSLSKKRAGAVVKYLVNKGVDEGRLVSDGYGDSRPIADNGTEAGRQQNRRVVFVILDKTPAKKIVDDAGDE